MSQDSEPVIPLPGPYELRPQFVLFGSSLVQYSYYGDGWGAIIHHLFARKADLVMRGYAAWNTRRALNVLDHVFPKDAAMQPSLVIVHFGSEDSTRPHSSGLGPHVPLEEYVNNMRKIAQHLKGLSENIRILFLSTPPVNENEIPEDSDGQKPRTNELSQKYSDALMKLCDEMDILAIDLFNAIPKRPEYFIDGVHLSPQGSEVVYKQILKTLKWKAPWRPSLYWTKMISEFGEDSPYDPVHEDGQSTVNASNYAYPHPALWGEGNLPPNARDIQTQFI